MFTYASNANPDWNKKCEEVFFSTSKGNEHTRYGHAKEKVAKQIMEAEFGKVSMLTEIGFLICTKYPWLGLSPDVIVLQNGDFVLFECKSLKIGKECTGLTFLRKVTYLKEGPVGHFQLKKRTSFYTQILLDLFVCNIKMGKLLLYNDVSKTNFYIDVPRDADEIKELVHSLTRTYFKYCLQFLCDKLDSS